MSSPSRMVELAATIQNHTNILIDYFKSHDNPLPSFDIDSPTSVHLPDEVAVCKTAVLEASDELQMLVLGPMGFLDNLHVQVRFMACYDKSHAET